MDQTKTFYLKYLLLLIMHVIDLLTNMNMNLRDMLQLSCVK